MCVKQDYQQTKRNKKFKTEKKTEIIIDQIKNSKRLYEK